MKTKMWIRIISTILSILFVLEILPISVMAEEYNKYKDLSNAELFTQQEEKSPIVSEVVSERDAFKKVFEREDGSFTAIISSGPVHYFEDGEWLEIDNTLTETNGTITNESNGFSVDLPSEITSDKNVTIATEKAELSFTMENISSSVAEIAEIEPVNDETSLMMGLDNIASSVEYTSVMTNTDLVYDIGADSVKESIILSSCPSQVTDYSYTINTNGATLYLNEDNSINVVKNGQIEFVIEAPYMFDSNGISTDYIDVSLENIGESTYTLTYSPDYDWLSSDERVYPVTIDPTTTVYSATAISEAFIGTVDSTATDLDKFHYLKNANRLYFKYSDSVSNGFGKNAVITNAEFSLYCEALTDDDTLAVFPISSEWTEETVTPVTETADLLDYNIIKYGESAKRYVWDITEIAAKWQMNQFDNNGISIRQLSDTINTKIYRSTTANLTSRRPWFQIDYVTIDNMAEYDTETVDMGRAGTFYLNKYTGTYYVKRSDLSLNGNVSPVEMSFTYDPWSASITRGSSYGAYWITDYYNKIFYSQTVTENDITRHQYTFRDNGGIKTRFVEVVSTDEDYSTVPEGFTESYLTDYTRYKAVSGDLNKCLWVPKSDTTYKDFANMIIEDSTYRYTIDSINRVTSRVHKTSGAVIAIEHRTASSDAIRSVTDGVGRKYDLPSAKDTNGKTITDKLVMYNSSGNVIKVSTLTGDVAIGVDYGYTAIDDATSHLTTVTYADGEAITYEYNTDGLMTSVTNVDGSRLELRYSGDRVIGYTKYAYYVSAGNSQNCFESQLDISFDGPKQRTFTYYEYDKTTPSIVTKQRYDSTLQATDYINSDGEYSYTKTITTDTTEIASYSTNDDEATNLIANGNFESGKTGWISVPDNASIGLPVLSETFAFDGVSGKMISLNSGLRKNLRVGQTISSLPANEDTVYTLSAWAKTYRSVATSYVNDHAHLDKTFAICVTDNEGNVLAQYDFDTTTDEWQFGAVSFETDVTLENIKVILMADGQMAYTRFDDVRLIESSTSSVEILLDEVETFDTQSTEIDEASHCSCSDCSDGTCNCHECLNEECDCIGECTHQTCVGCSKSKDIEKNEHGSITSQSTTVGDKSSTTSITYTENGNYVSDGIDPNGTTTTLNYNEDNGYLDSVVDGNGNQISYKYTAYGALAQVSQVVSGLSNGSFVSKEYTYLHDRLTAVTHNGFSYTFDYDGYGNKTSVKVENQALVNYSYNTDRSLNTIEYSNGQKIHYNYTDYGFITGIWFDDDTNCKYTYNYDSAGRLVSSIDNINSTITNYAEDNSFSVYEYSNGTTGELIYSTSFTDEGSTINNVYGNSYEHYEADTDYNHDTGTSVVTNRIENGDEVLFDVIETTDYFDREISQKIKISDNMYYNYEYSYGDTPDTAKTQLDSCVYSALVPSGTLSSVTWSWDYDNNGNLTHVMEYNPETQVEREIYTYLYDEAGQLIRCNDFCEEATYTYTYDIGGNLVTKKIFAYTTGELGEPLDTINYTYDSIWKDQLTSFDGKTIIYDSVGNPLSYDGWSFTWSAGRQLSSVSNADKSLAFKYNDRGLRTEKTLTVNGITTVIEYVWNEDKLISQSDGINQLYFIYDSEDRPIAFVLNGNQTFYYMKSPLGDVVAIYDKNGVYAGGYQYDSWGNCTSNMSDDYPNLIYLNPFRYRGYVYDSETKLYYLQSRYYNPEWGRFINADDVDEVIGVIPNSISIIDNICTVNLFAYALNNSVMCVDYTGKASTTKMNAAEKTVMQVFFIVIAYNFTTIKGCSYNGLITTKGAISINFLSTTFYYKGQVGYDKVYIRASNESDNFYSVIDSYKKAFGEEVYSLLADVALEKFKQEYYYPSKKNNNEKIFPNRDFLFSKKCLTKEIKLHFEGYMWSINKKGYYCPLVFTLYKIVKVKTKANIGEACRAADILERGVHDEILESIGFDYYNGINNKYQKTKEDPYFNTVTKKRSRTVYEDWKYLLF